MSEAAPTIEQATEAATAEQEATPSIELNLRLDENGRTTYDPATLPHQGDAKGGEQPTKRTKIESRTVDYSSKTTLTSLYSCKAEGAMDALLFDCEVCTHANMYCSVCVFPNN